MSDDKLYKYESESSLPSLKMQLVEKKTKGTFNPPEQRLFTQFRPTPEKRNAVTRLIAFLRDEY